MSKNEESISRTKFLKKLGISGSAIFAATYCAGALSSCSNEKQTVTPTTGGGGLLTIDLSKAEFSALNTKGGFIIKSNIVVANTSDGEFVAVPLTCSHEGRKEVIYRTNEFYCTAHGAKFDNAGKGTNGAGKAGLKLYSISKMGTVLTIS
jgi:cytochrome b6-f complex iron-sulfur subunit